MRAFVSHTHACRERERERRYSFFSLYLYILYTLSCNSAVGDGQNSSSVESIRWPIYIECPIVHAISHELWYLEWSTKQSKKFWRSLSFKLNANQMDNINRFRTIRLHGLLCLSRINIFNCPQISKHVWTQLNEFAGLKGNNFSHPSCVFICVHMNAPCYAAYVCVYKLNYCYNVITKIHNLFPGPCTCTMPAQCCCACFGHYAPIWWTLFIIISAKYMLNHQSHEYLLLCSTIFKMPEDWKQNL